MKTRILTATVSALAILAFGATAQAETVTTTTQTTITEKPVVMVPVVPATTESVTTTTKSYVQQKAVAGAPTRINFDAFDRNQNGILSMAEVGEHLFFIFDTDGNEVIDNIEFNNKRVITIAPMEKHTLKMVDFESDGSAELSTYTYETFTTTSGLTRFDNDLDGLSASEFIDTSMLKLDTDESKSIELDEWKKAYIASRAPQSADQDGYNI
ncbi:MAG: hypothetical protein KKA05_00160 [Alphaproteobacteria bacterium]|nr:hypothetical protein [Alphaproteobacteria bacterium]